MFVVLSTCGYAITIHIPGDYSTIQAGIDAASDGDTVLVANGTYTGTGNKNIDFNGKAIVVISENGAENCIIDCEDDGRGFYFHSWEYLNSILDGFTIMNGYGIPGGGGIYCHNSSPSIINCIIIDNISSGTAGGGILCWTNSHAIINNCQIINNNETGICCDMSSPTITNCVIRGNIGGNGGGIIIRANSDPIISNCTITENIATYQGGGIHISTDNPVITNCTISGNTAETYGGGIYSQGSEFVMSNSIVSDNNGQYGIHFSSSQDATVNFCDFHNNENGNFTGNMPMFIGYITTTNANGDSCDQYYNIFLDPLFTPGPDGDYYLSQPAGGQAFTSPCVDAGDALVPPNWGTTCTNQGYDIGMMDMGYHHPHLEGVPLPVEMTLFTATGGDSKVIIRWVTASEWNNSHFNLYRSYA